MSPLRTLATAPFTRCSLAALLYALLGFPFALCGALLTIVGLLVGGVLSVTPLGLWLIAATLRGALALSAAHRGLARRLLAEPVATPQLRTEHGVFGWRRALLGDTTVWRTAGYLVAAPITALLALLTAVLGYVYGPLLLTLPLLRRWNNTTVHEPDGRIRHVGLSVAGVELDSWPRALAVSILGAALLLAAPWLLNRALAPHRRLLRALLGPSRAHQRIRDLEETRAQAVDDAAATLRRIERDLHDGTQVRLVGLGMHLTLIRELVATRADPARVLDVIDTARHSAKAAIGDLRTLVRGIHPPVLNQGLDAALATLAAASALPVTLTVNVADRPSPAIESITYFCAAELLANAAKHSGADRATIDVHRKDDQLRLTVSDNGHGGARPELGSGLAALLARVRTVDGTLDVTSPAGGPTVVTAILPC